jgi:hypothetical protein
MRWFYKTHLSVSADVGYVLTGSSDTNPGHVKPHLNLYYRF